MVCASRKIQLHFSSWSFEKVLILSMLEQPRTYLTYKQKSAYFLQSVLWIITKEGMIPIIELQ